MISLSTVFAGEIKGLKKVILGFLNPRGVKCMLQTTMLNDGMRATFLSMEGEHEALHQTRDLLVLFLNSKFSTIKIDDWDKHDLTEELPASIIKPTLNSDSPHSSGCFDVNETDQDSFARIASFCKSGGYTVLELVKKAGSIKKSFSESFNGTGNLVLHVSYDKVVFVQIDAGGVLTLADLFGRLSKNARLKVPKDKQITKMYSLLHGKKSYLESVSTFKDGGAYYVETDDEVSFGTLEDFYALLKIEGLDDGDVGIIKSVFEDQKIKVKHLQLLTDEELEKVGITQIGLRKSILAVLGK